MRVSKVLNNNVVISTDKNEREVVVMGRGIGFQQKPGMEIPTKKIQKIFTLTIDGDDSIDKRYRELLEDIPLPLLEATENIIELAQSSLGKELHPSIRISLADHINFAIERLCNGQIVENGMLWEIKQLYPEEFKIGCQALILLKNASGISFAEDEAGFIAMHLVNAQLNEDMNNTISVTKLIRDIVQMIKYGLSIDLNESSDEFRRLVIHLKFFVHRLIHQSTISDEDDELFQSIRIKYPIAYVCVEKISRYVEKQFKHAMTSEEMMFLTIHVERVRRAPSLPNSLE
ncbi:BglG family transcription antiterminator LicT [Vibrio porteresiae]|uniref:PRD domain-containing protein n=1 Tax=Vibrio porteresiae DSM 19223 TaxID=1123496 RepID=A0ABZ0QI95_9VIBR|nr:PRD domain-containing protein [Vibrio porteresiae]WPC76213.1 PRD domain-containing protein [Vibrio porteresiae DSM 19223]